MAIPIYTVYTTVVCDYSTMHMPHVPNLVSFAYSKLQFPGHNKGVIRLTYQPSGTLES